MTEENKNVEFNFISKECRRLGIPLMITEQLKKHLSIYNDYDVYTEEEFENFKKTHEEYFIQGFKHSWECLFNNLEEAHKHFPKILEHFMNEQKELGRGFCVLIYHKDFPMYFN